MGESGKRQRAVTARGGPFFDPAIARGYEAWYSGTGSRADRLEAVLLSRLLGWIGGPGTLVEIGVGTGHFARSFDRAGWSVVGVDISAPMLLEAVRRGGPPVALGDALRLPFEDLGFDVAALVTVLEFVADPEQVIREAARVSRRGLVIGALNRSSRLGRRVRNASDEPWRSAHLLTVAELLHVVAAVCGGRPHSVAWRTTLWPVVDGAWALPWGDFIGLVVGWRNQSRKELPT